MILVADEHLPLQTVNFVCSVNFHRIFSVEKEKVASEAEILVGSCKSILHIELLMLTCMQHLILKMLSLEQKEAGMGTNHYGWSNKKKTFLYTLIWYCLILCLFPHIYLSFLCCHLDYTFNLVSMQLVITVRTAIQEC